MAKYHEFLDTDPHIKRVVVAAVWDKYFGSESKYSINGHLLRDPAGEKVAINSFGNMIRSLIMRGKEVVVVLSVPNGEKFDPQHFFHRSFFGISLTKPPDITNTDFLENMGHHGSRKDLAQIAMKNGAIVIDPMDYLSDGTNCLVSKDGTPIRYDDQHLRSWFVRDQIRYLDGTIGP